MFCQFLLIIDKTLIFYLFFLRRMWIGWRTVVEMAIEVVVEIAINGRKVSVLEEAGE
jgi:hypothetical protein